MVDDRHVAAKPAVRCAATKGDDATCGPAIAARAADALRQNPMGANAHGPDGPVVSDGDIAAVTGVGPTATLADNPPTASSVAGRTAHTEDVDAMGLGTTSGDDAGVEHAYRSTVARHPAGTAGSPEIPRPAGTTGAATAEGEDAMGIVLSGGNPRGVAECQPSAIACRATGIGGDIAVGVSASSAITTYATQADAIEIGGGGDRAMRGSDHAIDRRAGRAIAAIAAKLGDGEIAEGAEGDGDAVSVAAVAAGGTLTDFINHPGRGERCDHRGDGSGRCIECRLITQLGASIGDYALDGRGIGVLQRRQADVHLVHQAGGGVGDDRNDIVNLGFAQLLDGVSHDRLRQNKVALVGHHIIDHAIGTIEKLDDRRIHPGGRIGHDVSDLGGWSRHRGRHRPLAS